MRTSIGKAMKAFAPSNRTPQATPRAEMPDFQELAEGDGFAMHRVEERGITLLQLGNLLAFFEEKFCGSNSWMNRKGEKLEVSNANLYDIVELIVKPATQKKQCSYVELVAKGPQKPKWFVSHWWGQKTFELAQCLLQHSADRVLAEEVAYWICAFAAIQWTAEGDSDWVAPDWVNMYASNQWYDPAASPFQKAMRLAEGTVSIIDSDASYFSRVWCCYEIWSTLMLSAATNLYGDFLAEGHYKHDIYTCVDEDTAVGLTDGLAPVDKRRGKHWWTTDKYHREKGFPISLARSALSLKLELGQATQENDRIHILNSIVGASNLDAKPPKEHPRYNQLNNTLRGRFAAAVWRKALEAAQPMNQYAQVLNASGLMNLAISFDSCKTLDDLGARALALGLGSSIRELDLDFNGCTALSDDGVEALAMSFPPSVRNLKVDLSGCKHADEGMRALSKYLSSQGLEHGADAYQQNYKSAAAEPSEVSFSLEEEACLLLPLLQAEVVGKREGDWQSSYKKNEGDYNIGSSYRSEVALENLALSFAGCGHLSEKAMLTVINSLPQKLKRLTLNFYGCITLGDDCLAALARVMPPSLTFLELRVARCPDISDKGMQLLAKSLPSRLTHLTLDMRFCTNLSDQSASAIAAHLPLGTRQLETDFVGCEKTTGAAETVLQKAMTERHAKLTFWGKDDFSVNM